ncbi:hypothetical protein WMF38_44770 [Sorangium sp. So ce118]
MTNPSETTAEMLERLCAIDWRADDLRCRNSRIQLMREYLRRAAWWADELGCTEEWPFFDIAGHVDFVVRADSALVQRLQEHLAKLSLWPTVKKSCEWSLHWAALRSTPGMKLPVLDEPFEPLIWMYERGGGFTTEHGNVNVSGALFQRRPWHHYRTQQPVVELDRVRLDALDASG